MIQKKSRLESITIHFQEGRYATVNAVFEVGAWDTDTNHWVSTPDRVEETLSTTLAAERKKINDILGVAATEALKSAEGWRETALAADRGAAKCLKERDDARAAVEALRNHLKDADGAANNALKLEKAARAEAQTFAEIVKQRNLHICKLHEFYAKPTFLQMLTFGLLGGRKIPSSLQL